jgi:hypothetical protein
MAKSKKTLVCSNCLDDVAYSDVYWVNREMHRSNPGSGIYRAPYCKKCLKDTDTYIDVHQEPKPKKKKK